MRRLAEVASLFGPFGFLPIHRSYAVNLRRVHELRPRDDGEDWEVKLEPPEVSASGAGRADGVSWWLGERGWPFRRAREGVLEPC